MTIDVQVFHDKLELLKEYLHHKIDGHRFSFKLNAFAIPRYRPDEILKMYFETGLLFYTSDGKDEPTLTMVSFEEFYNQRTKIQITK